MEKQKANDKSEPDARLSLLRSASPSKPPHPTSGAFFFALFCAASSSADAAGGSRPVATVAGRENENPVRNFLGLESLDI